MLRRTCSRRVTNYDFGQNPMHTGFGPVYLNKMDASHIKDQGVQRSKLPNGITVVTHDQGLAASAVGIFAEAGAKFDPAAAPGLSHFAQWAILTSNAQNSLFQIDRALRAKGTSYGRCEVNKRHIGAWAYGNRSTWRSAVEQLVPAFAVPRFAEADLERWRDTFDNLREEKRWNEPREYAVDQLETVAFFREPLGNPRVVAPEYNDKCSSSLLLEQYASYMGPDRLTIVGVNIPHQELIAAHAQQAYQSSSTAPHHAKAAKPSIANTDELKQYYPARSLLEFEDRPGAIMTKPDMDQEGIVAIGWRTVGCDESAKRYAAGLVFREMLNLSAGVAVEPSGIATATGVNTFYRPFSTAGLVGFTVRDEPSALPSAVQTLIREKFPTDFVAPLAAAKARAAVQLHDEWLETDVSYLKFLAGSKYSATELLEAIRSTSVNDVVEVAEIAKGAAPCLYATGDVMQVPTIRQMGIKA